jgi:hypothetical protein
MSATYAAGKQWYLTNFFNDVTPAAAVTLNSDGTISASDKRAAGNYNGALATIGKIATAPYFVGTAFGCGAYVDSVVSFNDGAIPPSPSALNWPSMWADSYELLLGLPALQWPGQASGYSHWLELDIFEKINPGGSYFGTLHDWFGVQSSPQTCPGSNDCEIGSYDRNKITPPTGTNWSQWHRVSALWVPATSTSKGTIEFYFDNQLMNSATETWAQYTNQPPPPVNSSTPWVTNFPPWAFGIVDQRRLAILFGSGSVTPINVQSVDVWQGPAACNVTN